MSHINDGGPAFPHDNQELFDKHRVAQPGMSLRDWFAGQALVGLIASNDRGAGDRIEDIPRYAFDIADAMLAERAKARGEAP